MKRKIKGRITRLDPSRTLTLRKQFQTDIRKRFNKLRKSLIELIVKEDALGLKQRKQLVFHAQDELGKWITVKGNHIFIPEGRDVGEVIKEKFEDKGKAKSVGKEPKPVKAVTKQVDTPESLPKEPGTIPVKPGYIRLYHQTSLDNLESIRKNGILYKHAKGIEGPKAVYASEQPFYGKNKNKLTIEFQVKKDEFFGTQVTRDITPDDFIAVHEPWHSHAKYIESDSKALKETLAGDNDQLLKYPEYKAAIEYIKKKYGEPQVNAAGRWIFQSTEQKLKAFQQWLKQRIAMYLVKEQIDDEDAWWNKYIMEGFKKGTARAFDDTRPQVRAAMQKDQQTVSDFYAGTKDEFLRSSFNWPTSREKIKLLASRTYTDLKGVTEGMAARISHNLVDGLTKGDSPRTIARQLSKDVDISRSRAETIARTEIIRTHAEGQLDAFEKLGVTAVGVMAEWSTAEDDRVCPLCQPLDGTVLKVQEARGLLPRHPNCRCAWIPANVGEDEKTQKRSKSAIELAIEKSYKAELPSTSKRTIAEQKKLSRWGGADKVISKKRPQSILK